MSIIDDEGAPQDYAKRRRGLSWRLLTLIDPAAAENCSDLQRTESSEGCGLMELDELFERVSVVRVTNLTKPWSLLPSGRWNRPPPSHGKRRKPPWAMLLKEPPTEEPALMAAYGVFFEMKEALRSAAVICLLPPRSLFFEPVTAMAAQPPLHRCCVQFLSLWCPRLSRMLLLRSQSGGVDDEQRQQKPFDVKSVLNSSSSGGWPSRSSFHFWNIYFRELVGTVWVAHDTSARLATLCCIVLHV